jgi:signal transduction histidine kinase
MADGPWNRQAAELPIVVLPAYYQTWWFRLLGVLVVASLLWSYWRSRIGHLERDRATRQAFSRQLIASQESERKRIAAELHDGLGQRLVIIKNLALFFLRAQDETAARDGKLRLIEEISEEATFAADESREISYNLRPFQLDRLGLSKAIEALIRTASGASKTSFSSELDNIDDVFPESLRINFYRIVQESVNNIIKHAQATEASVIVKRAADRVMLMIRDNGAGFTPSNSRFVTSQELGQNGFGLIGIAERARLLGGQLALESAPGRGTIISVQIHCGSKTHG